jgi:glucokinase
MILAGDVGGTKTRLALYNERNRLLEPLDTATYASRAFASLEDVVRQFLKERKATVERAGIGVPGPVVQGEVKTTNLPWTIREADIARVTGTPKVKLVNDLVATCSAIPNLPADSLLTIHAATPAADAMVSAVLAPGTGLGQAYMLRGGGISQVLPSEGGHASFAPENELESELLSYLRQKHDRVSYERVLSGQGLVSIYEFLKQAGYAEEPEELRQKMTGDNPAAVIGAEGQAGHYELCVRALAIFAAVLGSQAGNLVLTLMATSGLYIGGGIPPKIIAALTDGKLEAAYLHKGRLSGIVKNTPLYLICDDRAALTGAAQLALQL